MVDVMWKLKKDERERIHEAIAERKCCLGYDVRPGCWAIYRINLQCTATKNLCKPIYHLALAAGIISKSVTNYKLEREN
jgi:hypothetical protein